MRKSLALAFCAAAALSMSACFTLQMHPVSFNSPTPDLGLSAGQKLPLRVAVVVPDPMGFRYYYTPPKGKRMDQTEQFRGEQGMPISGELARLAAETFPVAFQNASVLRHEPTPGEYDAVIELAVVSIDETIEIKSGGFGGADSELWMDWKLSVLDKGNVELLSKKGTTERRRFNIKAGFSAEPVIQAMGREGG